MRARFFFHSTRLNDGLRLPTNQLAHFNVPFFIRHHVNLGISTTWKWISTEANWEKNKIDLLELSSHLKYPEVCKLTQRSHPCVIPTLSTTCTIPFVASSSGRTIRAQLTVVICKIERQHHTVFNCDMDKQMDLFKSLFHFLYYCRC